MGVIRKNLWMKKGIISLAGKTIPFWGFSKRHGKPQIPGPTIRAKVDDIIKIALLNGFLNQDPIEEPISIIFPGQENVKVKKWPFGERYRPVQPQYDDEKLISYTNFVEPTIYDYPNALLYRFKATRPGMFLYESGTNSEKQIQMGAYGAIIVKPKGYNRHSHPNYKTAYGANTRTEYDIEAGLVLGEIDSIMHENVTPNTYYDMLKFNPDYSIINGRVFPETLNNSDNSSQPYRSQIFCKVGQRVLLRIINAGYQNHTLYFGGLHGRVVAEDSFPLVSSDMDATYEKTGITLGAGKSADIILIPTMPGEFYLYDRQYNHIVNNDQFPGGMMTRLNVSE